MALLSTRHDAAFGSGTELCWELSADEGNQDFRWSGSLGGSAACPPSSRPHTHAHAQPTAQEDTFHLGTPTPRKARTTEEGAGYPGGSHGSQLPSRQPLPKPGYFRLFPS